MLGINCLLNNPQIQQNLRDIIEVAGYELAAQKGSAKINDLYNVLIKSGIEMDIQTLSNLYEDIFDTTDGTFSDSNELSDAREDTYRKMADKQSKVVSQKIGKDKPSVAAAANLVNTLIKDIPDKSQQKIFQERLIKAAKRILGVKASKVQVPIEDLINQVISTEIDNDFYGLGTMDNARTLFNELAKELEQGGKDYKNAQMEQWGQILKGTTLDFLASNGEIKTMVDETFKDNGYVKEIGTGTNKKQVVDWDKIIKNNVDFKAALKSLFIKKGINETQADMLVNPLVKNYNDILSKKIQQRLDLKNKENKSPEQKNNIDRMVELYQLGIFGNANQNAIAKVTGITGLQQNQMSQLRQIIQSYNQGLKNNIATWSPTYVRTIQRQIENLLFSFENDKSTGLNIANKLASYMQWSNAAILSNPQNIAENIISGFIEANIVTGAINPKNFLKGISDFTTKMWDFMKGGVRVGEEKSNVFNKSGNIEDIYNAETKSGKRPDVIVSTIPRVLLGAFDNGFKHQIVQSLINKTLRDVLIKQGATKQQANIILNDIYYGNKDEIEKIARKLIGSIVGAGVNTKTTQSGELNTKEKVIASELSLANMLTEGKFFQDILNDLINTGKIPSALRGKIKLDEDLLRDIREAAYSTAAKGLGHEADNRLLKLFDNRFDILNKKVEEAKKRGDYTEAAEYTFYKTLFAGINKFRQGGFNWMFLGLQKASGLSLAQTLITDVLLGKKFGIPKGWEGIDLGNEETRVEQMKKYMALRQRLVRETIPVLFSYSIAAAGLAYIKGDGDDEEKKKRAREFKKYLDNHPAAKRWFNKVSPQSLYMYMENINTTELDKLPSISESDADFLKKNNIYDISNDNISTVQNLLNLSQSDVDKLQAKVNEENTRELPSLMRLYISPTMQATALKNTPIANPLIQGGIDLMDKRKPDKGAVMGSTLGGILNLGGILKSVDIWKNVVTNPEKIQGEYKIIKPQGFVEGFMYQTLNKDLYKKGFVGEDKLRIKIVDLPHIGEKGVQKLNENNITEINDNNINDVQSILELSNEEMEDISKDLKFRKEKIEKIKN